jgi:hypothetical protein
VKEYQMAKENCEGCEDSAKDILDVSIKRASTLSDHPEPTLKFLGWYTWFGLSAQVPRHLVSLHFRVGHNTQSIIAL